MFLKLFAVILISKKIIIRVLIYVAVGQISCGIIVYGRRFGLLREQWGRPWGLQWGGGGGYSGGLRAEPPAWSRGRAAEGSRGAP